MQDYGNKEKFSIDLAKGELSTSTKKYWDQVVEVEIQRYARENNLSAKQVEDLRKIKMIETLYLDLNAKNQYMARTNDEFAVRAIRRNKEKMYEMDRMYNQFDDRVHSHSQDVTQKIENQLNKQQNKTTKNNK